VPFSFNDVLTGIGALGILIGVLVLTYYVTRWYARRLGGGAFAGKYIVVHDRVTMSRETSLAIIEINGRFYLIGVGEQGVNLVSELEGFAPIPSTPPHSKIPFEKLYTDMLGKFGRKSSKGDNGSDT